MAESVPPPQNPEAEAMLLASLMAADTYVAEALSLVADDDFYREGHRAVFRAIEDLFSDGGAGRADHGDRAAHQGRPTSTTPAAAVAVLDLMETPFIAASYRTYAEIVRDTATQRRLLQVGQADRGDGRPARGRDARRCSRTPRRSSTGSRRRACAATSPAPTSW